MRPLRNRIAVLELPPRGAMLVFAIALTAALALVGVLVINLAGSDRIESNRVARQRSGLECAEAGLQYGRVLFGQCFLQSNGWNDYLSANKPGRHDPEHFGAADSWPTNVSAVPLALRGDLNGDGVLEVGADLDGDGKSDFLVSIRDDDDEVALGTADNRQKDNNLTVILRSECTNPRWAIGDEKGKRTAAVVEALVTYVPMIGSEFGGKCNGCVGGGSGELPGLPVVCP